MSTIETPVHKSSFTIKAKLFAKIMDALHDIVDGWCMFKIGSTGLSLRQMDVSHVSLVCVSFPLSSFEKFETDEQEFYFGFNIVDFIKRMPKEKKNSMLNGNLTVSAESARTSPVSFYLKQKKIKREIYFQLKNNPDDPDVIRIPPTPAWDNAIQIQQQLFLNNMQYLAQMCDVFCISTSTSAVILQQVTTLPSISEADPLEIQLNFNGSMTLKFLRKETFAEYPTRHLHTLAKALSGWNESLFLYQKEDVPLNILCEIGNGIVLNYYIAPKLSDDVSPPPLKRLKKN